MIDFIRTEFLGIFGLAVFAFIIGLSIWGIYTGRRIPRIALSILLVIGIGVILLITQ